MGNIVDYLSWRGDISFSERPFNDVDNIILAVFSYLDLTGIVPSPGEGSVTIAKACQRILEETKGRVERRVRSMAKLDPALLTQLAGSRRFGTLKLHDCVDVFDVDRSLQFAAVQIDINDKATYVSFRGTDSTLVGWREDFKLSFTTTEAQREAARYLTDAATQALANDHKLYVGGHSKGGNLAVYATLMCPLMLLPAIALAWCNDGPGISPDICPVSPRSLLGDRYRRIVPAYDMIGIIFEREDDPLIVTSSRASGMWQHDPFTWQVTPFGVVEEYERTPESRGMKDALDAWVAEVPPERRAVLVDQLFDALEAGGAHTLDEVASTTQGASAVWQAMGDMDDSTKQLLRKLVGDLARSALDAAASVAQGVAASALQAAWDAVTGKARRGDQEPKGELKEAPAEEPAEDVAEPEMPEADAE